MDEKQQKQQFQDWLPFYLNGGLGETEHTWMQQYLSEHPSEAAELQFDRLLKSSLVHQLPEYAPDTGLKAFMARVRSEPEKSKQGGFFDAFRQFMQHSKNLFGSLIPDPKWAMASVLLIAQAGIIAVLLSNKTETALSEQAQWRTPTKLPEFHGPVLQITFKPSATEAEMRLLLVKISGVIVGGPGQLGNYLVKVPNGKMEAAENQVRTSSFVESAQVLQELPLDQ